MRGNSLELEIQTDHQGFFTLPPVRPGQYTVSMTKSSDVPPLPNADPAGRGPARDKATGRLRRESQRGFTRTERLKKPDKASELAREYADKQIVPLSLDEWLPGNIVVDF